MNEKAAQDFLLGQISALETLLFAVIRTLPPQMQNEVRNVFQNGAEAARVALMNLPVSDQARAYHDQHLVRLHNGLGPST